MFCNDRLTPPSRFVGWQMSHFRCGERSISLLNSRRMPSIGIIFGHIVHSKECPYNVVRQTAIGWIVRDWPIFKRTEADCLVHVHRIVLLSWQFCSNFCDTLLSIVPLMRWTAIAAKWDNDDTLHWCHNDCGKKVVSTNRQFKLKMKNCRWNGMERPESVCHLRTVTMCRYIGVRAVALIHSFELFDPQSCNCNQRMRKINVDFNFAASMSGSALLWCLCCHCRVVVYVVHCHTAQFFACISTQFYIDFQHNHGHTERSFFTYLISVPRRVSLVVHFLDRCVSVARTSFCLLCSVLTWFRHFYPFATAWKRKSVKSHNEIALSLCARFVHCWRAVALISIVSLLCNC